MYKCLHTNILFYVSTSVYLRLRIDVHVFTFTWICVIILIKIYFHCICLRIPISTYVFICLCTNLVLDIDVGRRGKPSTWLPRRKLAHDKIEIKIVFRKIRFFGRNVIWSPQQNVQPAVNRQPGYRRRNCRADVGQWKNLFRKSRVCDPAWMSTWAPLK